MRWRDGVLRVLDPAAHHGLKHVWFALHGYSTVTTHQTKANHRFFDHLLVSKHFHIVGAGYHHDGWRNGPSDHSAAWARLELQ